ncbi:PhzF family phenazine biosynthesis protein [Streptomyces cavernae]|uniref:PhzF family phenazine biosynthesis protein n=1 Tax=Streptomyces cavernae TaxID=2259034 RepID=UPI000FEC1967|nr:PhzF family phenazine biosynthesis protein [Streptomyces cavernae]
MTNLQYDILDVFADRPYAGNPLAVVHGGESLTDTAMQAIAREFHLSETVFTLPPTVPGADYRVRIFTPTVELSFAGHPSIGAAWLLARRGVIGHGKVRQQCGAGVIPVRVDDDGARIAGGRPEIGKDLDAAPLAAAVGLTVDDVDVAGAPGAAAAGAWFAFLPVHDEAVARARPDAAALIARTVGMVGLVLFSYSRESRRAHIRMFAPGSGVAEDPGGGSSAVALGVHLVHRGMLSPDGRSAFIISQGAEIGRTSTMDVEVRAESGRAMETSVRGAVIAVARGELTCLP